MTQTKSNGDYFEGSFSKGKFTGAGMGKLSSPSGECEEGTFQNVRFCETELNWFENFYEWSKLESGRCDKKYPNGNRYVGGIVDGFRDGIGKYTI